MKRIVGILICAMMFFCISAFASDGDYIETFDNIKSADEVKMTPGAGLSLSTVSLDSTIKRGESGNSLKIAERLKDDYRIKFDDAISDLTPGTRYYISMWATVNDNSADDYAYVYLGVYSPEKGKYRAIYNDKDAQAKCKQLISKDKWTKLGFIYTVEDTKANMVGIEQTLSGGLNNPVDLNVDDVSVIKVDANFTITDLPQTENREYNSEEKVYTKFTQIGIVKMDDLKPNDTAFNKFEQAKKILDKYGVKGGFGVIAQGFENCDEKYYDKMKEWASEGFEIWHHGYYHTQYEYSSNSYQQQYEDFKRAHDVIKEKTGIEMTTFGSPNNNAGETFISMVTKEFPNYKILLYVTKTAPSDKLFMANRINIENDTGKPDFEYFKEGYTKIPEVFGMQSHPPYFTDEGMEEFEKIIEFCVNEGIVLMTPCEYYDYANSIKVIVDKEKLFLDVYPIIKNDRTLVPMRAIFEKLGATVDWDDATKTVTATKDGVEIKLPIDKATAMINGSETKLDTPATIENSRTMVPVRFISEALGKTVEWDAENRYVIVK